MVLSYSTWQQYFNARPDIAGSQVRLNGKSYTVVGVLPRDFYLAGKASDFQARRHFDVWTNLGLTAPPEAWQRETHPLFAFARLKSGVPMKQAQADLTRIALDLARLYPDADQDHTIDVVPMADNAVGGVRTALFTLLGGVGIVLLIACANIANLLLTRAAARRKEMALRAALGASRKRLARQLLTESGVLAAIGSGLGFALALWAVPFLTAHLPSDLPRTSEIAVDGRVLAFTSLIAIATGILFGLAPLVSSRGVRLNARGIASGQSRLRNALIVGQVALALVLLVGAGLMAKSLRALLQVSPGFRTDRILTARLSLPPHYANVWKFGIGLRREESAFLRALESRARHPGCAIGRLRFLSAAHRRRQQLGLLHRGPPAEGPGVYDSADYRPVSAGYFETMGIPIMRGRPFTAQDDEDHPLAIVINESMARQFWPAEDPLGKRLKFGSDDWRTIVGIVKDVHHQALASAPQAEMYVPWGQVPNVEIRPTVVVRSFVEPASLTGALRKAVAEVDPEVPMDQVATMQQLVSGSVSESRFRAAVLSLFALLALFVASIGLYGSMSYLVSQRTREFGIRIAVGASRGAVLRQVLQQGAKLAAIGVVIGLAAAALVGRLIASLLYGVKPLDAATLAGVSLLLAAIALLASYIPARRAANADPMDSLRYE